MAKRTKIGSILKSKEAGKPDYIKIEQDVTLTKGQFLSLESKKSKIESIESAMAAGKLNAELGHKLLETANKMPDFVRFDIVLVNKE